MIKLLFLTFALDTLPTTPSLYESLSKKHASISQADQTEFQHSEKLPFLKYIPNLGITYTLEGKPRPHISFDFGVIYRIIQDKEIKKQKLLSIREHARLNHTKDIEKLTELLKKHQLLITELDFIQELISIDKELLQLYEADLKAAILSPTEFLIKKKSMIDEKKKLLQKQIEIQSLEAEIISFVK
jgi:hypothetical protein